MAVPLRSSCAWLLLLALLCDGCRWLWLATLPFLLHAQSAQEARECRVGSVERTLNSSLPLLLLALLQAPPSLLLLQLHARLYSRPHKQCISACTSA